jgi:hypothetical protein
MGVVVFHCVGVIWFTARGGLCWVVGVCGVVSSVKAAVVSRVGWMALVWVEIGGFRGRGSRGLATLGVCLRLRVIRVMSVLLLFLCRCCAGRVPLAGVASAGRTSCGWLWMRPRRWVALI